MDKVPPFRPYASQALGFVRKRLGWASCVAYAAAVASPGPGLWARHGHSLVLGEAVHLEVGGTQVLLFAVLFAAGLRTSPQEITRMLRRPGVIAAGLALHAVAPLLIIPLISLALRCSADSDGGSGMVAAMMLTLAMPVAAGATVWTTEGRGDEPTMLGLVLVSALVSPLTMPLTISTLAPLLTASYADPVTAAAAHTGVGFALTGIVVPCALGMGVRRLLAVRAEHVVLRLTAPVALLAALLLTYVNASGALGQLLVRPRPLLLLAAAVTAVSVCALSFGGGSWCARALRLPAGTGRSLTLACGMSNSSASAVLITVAMPDRPQILLPVLVFGVLQKLAANRITALHAEAATA
ncbi:bile acid:sodium symporter family protein [Streptomyces sp. NPDC048387]|uniref:bile acid:sodium symporter family protein n=1 Tax=Streptomyces sp. NPDC048387 TaxID=3365542 RepID=UPI00371A215E